MAPDFKAAIADLWMAVGIVWLVGALTAKRTIRRQSAGSLAIQMLLGALVVVVGFAKHRFIAFSRPFLPDTALFGFCGLLLTIVGIGFAIWARFALGRNWSGMVTVKEDHALITHGPYAVVRHPIYTGFLTAALGSAIAFREIRGLIATAIVYVLFTLKIRVEEAFMVDEFGARYVEYRRRVRALIPFVH